MEDSAQIVVRRPSGGGRDLLRKYRIEIDGETAGAIGRGAEAEFAVPAGEHRVRATIDWLGSPTLLLELIPGEVARLTVRPGGHPFQFRHLFAHEGYLGLSREGAAAEVVESPAGDRPRFPVAGLVALPFGFGGIFLFFFGLNGWLHDSASYGWAIMLGGVLCYAVPLVVVRRLRRRRRSGL